MILYLSFEELSALRASTEHVLAGSGASGHGIAAPPRLVAEVERFASQLDGDIGFGSLDEQRAAQRVVTHLLDDCRARLDAAVLEEHAGAEGAVAAYFAYAHMLTINRRVDAIGEEMAAIVEVLGEDPGSEAGRRFFFPE